MSAPSDVIDATPSVSSTSGLTSVVPSGSTNTTLPAASSAITAWPSGVAADAAPPSPVTSASTSSVEATDSNCSRGQLPDAHRRLVDDQRAVLDGVDVDVLADTHAGRVGDALDAVVDDGDHTGRAVVDDDDPRRLVDVEVGPGIRDADRRRDLTDLHG